MQDIILDNLVSFQCPNCSAEIQGEALEPFSTTVCPSCEAETIVPAQFGQFQLLERTGDGIMSMVYRAWDPKLDRMVSLKILNRILSKNEELAEAFKREALAAAALNATNVLKVYEYRMHNTQPFMVMEHIDGRYLSDALREQTPTELRILEITRGITQGLIEKHEAGIVHGDVMPRNILLDENGNPKISDFGLARFSNDEYGFHESWSSPYYMPPERATGGEEDHRGDIYSLGTTLYFMLTGHLPFFDMDEDKVRQMKVENDPPDVHEHNPHIHKELADLTKRMLARNPADCFDTYEDLIRELDRVRMTLLHQQHTSPTDEDDDDLPALPGSKLPILIIAMVVLAVVYWVRIVLLP